MSQGIGLPEGSLGGLAYDALEMARHADGKAERALQAVDSHEDICAERYRNINEKIGTIFKLLAWGGTTALMLILGLLGFLAKTQFDSMKARDDTTQQIAEILRRQSPPPQVIVQPAPGATTTGASVERQP